MFSRKEKQLFQDSYFEILKENEQYVELRSVCTGHCWAISKNCLEQTMKITLHHKHKRSDNYYHRQGVCRTVMDAISQIKSHDAYVLEQNKNSEGQPVERKLKVYSSSGYNYNQVPMIMLKGEWLRDTGFSAGDQISVVSDGAGRIIITAG